jgi:SOS response regulatory protein OraA/RecX
VLADAHSAAAAEEVALRILSAAAQSASALWQKLRQRGFSEAVSSQATASMVDRGYVNDVALGGAIAARRRRTGHGRIRIAAELHMRGLDADAVAASILELDPDGERTTALELGRRLARRHATDVTDRSQRQRVGAALQRRGFDTDTVGWVLRELERKA